jgi:tetratricopeptide (TPR) repeat protein
MTQMADRFLDADELLYLALDKNRRGRTEESLVTLKRALGIAPNDARVHYVLGSMYNQIGMIERAEKHLQHATVFDPNMENARFELGWLYWSAGQADAAAETWKAFDSKGKEYPLFLFKTALLQLAKNEYAECEKNLRAGLSVNGGAVPYAAEMAQLYKQVSSYLATLKATAAAEPQAAPKPESVPAPKPAAPTSKTAPGGRRLDAYKQEDPDEKKN